MCCYSVVLVCCYNALLQCSVSLLLHCLLQCVVTVCSNIVFLQCFVTVCCHSVLLQRVVTLCCYSVLYCVVTVRCYSVLLQHVVMARCYNALLQCAVSWPTETSNQLCRLPQGFPAAVLRLSLVSLSVDAARQPSAFIAQWAHTRSDIYCTWLVLHVNTEGHVFNSGHNRLPCVYQPVKR